MRQSVCFVSETGRTDRPLLDPSVRYRCFHAAEALVAEGQIATVYAAPTFFQAPALDYDVYVFHRPNAARPGFHAAIDALERRGATLVADYDDLVFGSDEHALDSSAARNGILTPERAVSAFRSTTEALRRFGKVTVSTAPLAEEARAFNPGAEVEVSVNEVPASMEDVHLAAGTPWRRRPSRRIGYFSGTKSHKHDFAIILPVLHRLLMEDTRRRLLVVGPVEVPDHLLELPSVEVHQVVDYMRLPSMMAGCDTVLAPLETTRFNSCKSRVKFLEAALSGCRLVATPIPDMVAVGEEHLVLARSWDDWYESLAEEPDPAARRALAERNVAYLRNQSRFAALRRLAGLDGTCADAARDGLRVVRAVVGTGERSLCAS